MKYLVTYLNIPNSDRGTAWDYLDSPPFKQEVIEGSLEIEEGIAIIFNYGISAIPDPETGEGSPTRRVVFAGSLKNVTIRVEPVRPWEIPEI